MRRTRKKQMTFYEWKTLGSVSKIIHKALLAMAIEIANKDGKVKNAKVLQKIDKTHSEFYDVKERLDNQFRRSTVKPPEGETIGHRVYNGSTNEDDLNAFVQFIRDHSEHRR
jgi:hypothetical protein